MKRAIALLLLGASLSPTYAMADSPAVRALLQQAQYWQAKGRGDLAFQALHRAQAIDPNNAEVKRALAGPAPAPAPAPAAKPAAKAAPDAVATRERAAPARPEPARSAPRAAPVAAADIAGRARVAGFAALQANDLATAAREFDSALARNRRDGDALGGLGLVAMKQGDFARARDLLDQASRQGDAAKWAQALGSARYFAGVGQAQDLAAHGQLGEAQKVAEDLVRQAGGKDRTALEVLADIYDRQGRYADSADLYRQASEMDAAKGDSAPDEKRLASRAARGRALAAAARGDDMAAEQEFQQGLMLDSEDPWIRYEFARFMIGRGRLPEAESLVQSLSSSTKPDGLYAAAMLQSDLGHPANAEALLQRIPEPYRTQPMRSFAMGLKTDTAIARAKALASGGQKAEAITALRQIGQVKGLPAARQAAIADALYDLGDAVDAGALAQQAMAGSITDLGGYEAIIRVATRTGRDDLAASALQRASQLAGSSPDGQRGLARISAGMAAAQADRLRLHGQYAEAFDVLQRAWGTAPDNVEILSALARVYQSGNMPARAAQTFQIILVHTPKDRDALSGLMETAQSAGDRALSQQAEARLLQTYPQSYEVYLAAARTEQARGNAGAATRYLKDARDIYNRQMAGAGGAMGSNPFGAGAMAAPGEAMGGNPFRATAAVAAPQPVNPFSLGGGTRLSALDAPVAAPAQGQASWNPPVGAVGQSNQFGGRQTETTEIPADSPQAGAMPPASMPSDPVLAQIQTEIADLSQDNGPRVEVQTAYRSRAGETGLSELREMKGSAEISTGLGGGRVYARADAVVIDSGRPTGSSLQRFGRDATIEAESIVAATAAQLVQATTQRQSGVAPTVGYADKTVQAEVGATPLGFDQTRATWRVAVTPQLGSGVAARAWFERKPVTDSVIAYGGTRDPVTGEFWGQVMRTGGGAGLSVDHDGNGVYVDLSYNKYAGTNVPTNHNVEANLGGYLRVQHTAHSNLTAGLNVNYQAYGNDQDYFTYGHGGYFSPQSFLSVGFPVNYTFQNKRLDIKGSFTPGFQSFLQDQVDLYPTDPTAQAALDVLKAKDSDVRNYYDSLSKTGFALAASGSAYYRIAPSTRVGGEVSYNTFGSYDEMRAMLSIRQSLGSTK